MGENPLVRKVFHPGSSEAYHYPRNDTQEAFEEALQFQARPDDIFICSYPKSGTTWLQHIVWLITHKGNGYHDGQSQDKCIPFIDFGGTRIADNLDTRGHQRILKTHLPFQWTSYRKEAKYMYVARNPLDVIVSWSNHFKGFGYRLEDCDVTKIFEMFVNSELPFNEPVANIASWFEKRNEPNVLFLLYEDLKTDLRGQIVRIAKFLGGDYWGQLEMNDEELLTKVVHDSTFSSMSKQSEETWNSAPRAEGLPFLRKGVVGDYKNHLDVQQISTIKQLLIERGSESGVDQLWKDI